MSEVNAQKQLCRVSICSLCRLAGYMKFGSATPQNIIVGFSSKEPDVFITIVSCLGSVDSVHCTSFIP